MTMTPLCDFRFFSITASTFGTGNGSDTGGILLIGLVFLITGWMEHIMSPTRSYSVKNSGRDPQTLQTDTQIDRAGRRKTQIHL
jgi:hypothetical protein